MIATRANLAKVYNQANLPQKALDYIKVNERFIPNDFNLILEKAFSLFLLNDKSESAEVLRQLLAKGNLPYDVEDRVNFNIATHDMYDGKYKQGLAKFVNSGTTLDLWQTAVLPLTKWDGIARPGKTLVIYAKGGIGDEIINVRFCENVNQLGMIPLWYTDRAELRTIFSRHGIKCINSLSQAPSDALWCHGMSLPVVLDLEPEQLRRTQYLTADPIYSEKWKTIITSNKVKVGLRWAGNMEYDHDLHRGLPIVDLYTAIKNDNCEYYSFQRDDGVDQTPLLDGVTDLQYELATYEDVLASLNQMDVFITSCTSLAHAAAALGKRVIVLVPITCYYVWIGEHWYNRDNVTVIHQTVPRSWSEPIAELQQHLKDAGVT
jgi:hypothetical protein